MSSASVKGWMRMSFEHAMRLTPQQCKTVDGHYVNPLTHALYAAFKAGISCSPSRGTFVIADLHEGKPYFPQDEEVHAYKDLATKAQRARANKTGAVVAIYHQISAYDPTWPLPKN